MERRANLPEFQATAALHAFQGVVTLATQLANTMPGPSGPGARSTGNRKLRFRLRQ